MGMREYPSSGYVVEASKLLSSLPQDQQAAYQTALEDCDTEVAQNILSEHLPESFPCFLEVWCPSAEDTVDEPMEVGGMYVIFDEADLYVRTPTPGMEALTQFGVTPEFQRWSVWG